jgi:hypothetical protein
VGPLTQHLWDLHDYMTMVSLLVIIPTVILLLLIPLARDHTAPVDRVPFQGEGVLGGIGPRALPSAMLAQPCGLVKNAAARCDTRRRPRSGYGEMMR